MAVGRGDPGLERLRTCSLPHTPQEALWTLRARRLPHRLWSGGLATILQTRLMDVAEDAQTLAAALNHSAFNVANALGPWLAGFGARGRIRPSLNRLGRRRAGLGGLAIWATSYFIEQRVDQRFGIVRP